MEKYKNEKHKEYIELGIQRAISSLKHFFGLLNIPEGLLDHLFDIEILIDYDNDCLRKIKVGGKEVDEAIAVYSSATNDEDDAIYISHDYVNKILLALKKGRVTRQDVINEFAATIIHELLHRNRTIILDNSLKLEDAPYYDKYNEIFKDYDISKYKFLLDEAINNNFYNYFDKIVPLSIINKGNNIYDVVAYNKETNTFILYNNQRFGTKKDMTLLLIGVELNSLNISHEPDVYISYKNGDYNEEIFYCTSEYYHQKGDTIEKRDERVSNQVFIEEAIVEVLARFILETRKNYKIDLEKIETILSKDRFLRDCDLLAGKMLMMMGLPTIKWFILSCHEEEYDDRLYKTFEEKYNLLLNYFKDLMIDGNDKNKVKEALEIIDEKIK